MLRVISVLIPALLSGTLLAQQPGSNDPTFNATDLGYGAGDGSVTNVLNTLAVQADGGVLIGGSIQRFNNVQRNNLVRLAPDGSVDLAFAPGALGVVNDLVVQPDGRILVADGLVRRLLPNGTEDPSFQGMACCTIRQLLLQPDGRILAITDEQPGAGLVRLLPNGELDPSFEYPFPGYPVERIALLPNGQILAVTDVAQTGSSRLRRFNSDGSDDGTFNCCPGPDVGGIGQVVVQPDGRIVVTGSFNTYNGAARPRLVRLESNGNVDLSFNADLTGGQVVRSLALRPDGRILLSGSFTTVQGQSRPGLAQLLANGTVDQAFTIGTGFGPSTPSVDGPREIALDPSGRVVCMGSFNSCQGAVRIRLARLLSDGALDAAYHQQTGVLGTVHDIAVRGDGSMLLAGYFSHVNGAPRRGLALLLADGELDQTFVSTSTSISSTLLRVAEQSTGKAVVMGQLNGTSTYVVSRVDPDGSPDATFNTGSGFNGAVTDIALQPDDKIIAGGAFTAYAGTTAGRIVRLLPDGQIDASFNTGSGFVGQVNCVRVLPDGKVLVGGAFTQYNGTAAFKLIRLNSDGSRDTGFSATVPGDIRTIALRADGRILIAYSGLVERIACLLPTGAQDPDFNNGINIGTTVFEIIELGNGSIFLVGNFSVPGTPPLTGFGLWTNTGQSEGSFAPGTGLGNPNSGLPAAGFCAAVQADGRILVGGQFTACNGVGRNRVVRLSGIDASPGLLVNARAFLDGSFSTGTGLMDDGLRAASLIPASEPYTALGYMHAGGGGSEQVASPVLTVTGNNAIVDWVVLELRDASQPATILATRSALLQRDGDVVDMDGTSPLGFSLPAGNYHIAIRHRNHLGVMTASPITLTATPATIDFTSTNTSTWGTEARKNTGSLMTLWPGDANFDGQVKYTGTNNDRDAVLMRVGGTTPTNVVSGYWGEDLNLDSDVKYTGPDNDRDIILQTIGGTVPTAVRVQQVP